MILDVFKYCLDFFHIFMLHQLMVQCHYSANVYGYSAKFVPKGVFYSAKFRATVPRVKFIVPKMGFIVPILASNLELQCQKWHYSL